MSNSIVNNITDVARRFLVPSNSTHRQYEALRAYFVERLPSAEAARRFGYSAPIANPGGPSATIRPPSTTSTRSASCAINFAAIPTGSFS